MDTSATRNMNEIVNTGRNIVVLVSWILLVLGAAGLVYGRIKRWNGDVREIYLIALIGGAILLIELSIT